MRFGFFSRLRITGQHHLEIAMYQAEQCWDLGKQVWAMGLKRSLGSWGKQGSQAPLGCTSPVLFSFKNKKGVNQTNKKHKDSVVLASCVHSGFLSRHRAVPNLVVSQGHRIYSTFYSFVCCIVTLVSSRLLLSLQFSFARLAHV